MKGRLRRATSAAAGLATVLAAAVLALALAPASALAFSDWQHAGATGCTSCHGESGMTDATCNRCHRGFRSYPRMTCWSCHAPGQGTSTLSSPGSACAQQCHLWNSIQKQYLTPSTHGADPHRGSSPACTGCHSTSVSSFNPGESPHHSGKATGFSASTCGLCHGKPQRHAGKVACTTCHATARAYHTYAAKSAGSKGCNACHTMRHAGKRVAQNRCAACHKGGAGRPVQHAAGISRSFACGGCHKKALHASARSKAVRNCRTCHKGKFHARQARPARSVCAGCHRRALRHTGRFQCTLCHRRAVHNARPSRINL